MKKGGGFFVRGTKKGLQVSSRRDVHSFPAHPRQRRLSCVLMAKITDISQLPVVTVTFCTDVCPTNDKISSSVYSQIISKILDEKLGGG